MTSAPLWASVPVRMTIQLGDPILALDDDVFAHRMREVRNQMVLHCGREWSGIVEPVVAERLRMGEQPSAQELVNLMAEACCHCRMPSGRALVEVYADENPELGPEVCRTLRSWSGRGRSYSRLRILSLQGRWAQVREAESGRDLKLFIGMEYEETLANLRPGWLLLTKLVPVRSFFTHIGILLLLSPEQWQDLAGRIGEQRRRPAQRERWAPAEGTEAPPLSSPCPCGSGQRYKKCCFRR